MPMDVNGHYWKPQGQIRIVLEEGHGYEISLRICTDVRIGTGFTDDKDASRTIRTGFTDRFVVSNATRDIYGKTLSHGRKPI